MLSESERNRYNREHGAGIVGLTTNYVVTLPHLRRERLRVPLSQRDLAKVSGVAASTIARIEAGGDVHPSTVRRLAQALKCPTTQLMSDADQYDSTSDLD